MSTLTARLARDFTANGRKTAALAGLTAVGLYFWLPPVWRAVRGTTAGVATVAAPSVPSSIPSEAAAAPAAATAFSWRTAERTRRADPLSSSAGRSDLRADAFAMRTAFLPIDAELVADAATDPFPPPATGAKTESVHAADPAASFALRSTVVGRGRKVALINGVPYVEGATVRGGRGDWVLLAVEAGRAVLSDGDRRIELRIDPFETAAAMRADPP